MGFKRDDGTFDDRCLERVRPGEPIFVLRAQDETMADMVWEWLQMNPQLPPDRKDEALANIDAVRKWQAEHPELVKAAD